MTSVTGIDTDSIVTQLMAAERRPQDVMKQNVTALQRAQNAWQAIADKLVGMKTAADALGGLDAAAALRTVTSGNPSVLAARSIGAGTNASASIEVLGLAAAHSVLATDVFGAPTDSVGARTLTITNSAGTPTTITSTDGTIGGLAAAVNAAGLGVNAKLLQTAPGQYQLSLSATTSGAAAAFTATGTGWGAINVVRQGQNASIKVDGVTIARSSNVISDVLDGVELTLTGLTNATTGAVNVTSTRDDAAIADKVKAFVAAANALASTVAAATKTSTNAAERGPLAGDFGARRMVDQVRNAVASPIVTASGKTVTSSMLGVSLQRDGTLVFDETKLKDALINNPDDVLAAIGRHANSTAAGVTVLGTTSSAQSSNRTITVTQAASQAMLVGLPTPPPAAGTQVSMNIVTPTGSYNVTFAAGASWTESAANLNAALRAAGVKMVAVAQAGNLDLREDRYGSGKTFTVTGGDAVGLSGTSTDGVDATGTIDGTAFTATGRSLTSGGLVLSIGTSSAQLAAAGGTVSGNVTLTNGLAGALAAIGAQGQSSGPALASKNALQDQIDDLNKRIDAFNDVLSQRERVLRTRFAAMEDVINKLKGMTSSLASLGVQA